MKRFIAIAGNIGVGKSTLTRLLCEKLDWVPFFEAVEENPYLSDFYQDMQRWAFHSQVFFLFRRIEAHRQIVEHPGSAIQDRSIYEDAEIFAENLYRQGEMAERDHATYEGLYRAVSQFLPPPDLIIYLRASVPTLQARISFRGREYERGVSTEYLERLNRLYHAWSESFALSPVLTIPADEMDFVKHEAHLEQIAAWLSHKALPEFFKTRPAARRRKRLVRVPAEQDELPGVRRPGG